jgi:hypothetical protein
MLGLSNRCLIVMVLAGCGGSVAGNDSAADSGTLLEARDAADGVGCGALRCIASQVCAKYADGSARCFERGSEPVAGKSPLPWPSVLLFCDGEEDCSSGTRCVMNVGEIFKAECVPESGDCPRHAGHMCSDDRDCHSCPNPGDPDRKFTCLPVTVTGATHLRACM